MKPKSIDQVVYDINTKDRRYRRSQILFMGLLTGLTITTLFIGLKNLDAIKRQNDQLKSAVVELKADTSAQLQKQNDYIRCIASFFANADRQNKTIANIDQCTINNLGDVITAPEAAQQSQAVAPQASPTPTPQAAQTAPTQATEPKKETPATDNRNNVQKLLDTIRGLL